MWKGAALFLCPLLLAQDAMIFKHKGTPSDPPPAFVNCKANDYSGGQSTIQTAASSITAGNGVYIIASMASNCGAASVTLDATQSDGATSIAESIINVMSGLTGPATMANGGMQNDSATAICSTAWYVSNATGNAGERWRATWSGSPQKPSISVMQVSGQATAGMLDRHVNGFGNLATTVTAGPTAATTNAGELAVAGVAIYAYNRHPVADSGWTLDSTCTSPNQLSSLQYKQLTTTQTVTTTMSVDSPNTYLHLMLATLKGI